MAPGCFGVTADALRSLHQFLYKSCVITNAEAKQQKNSDKPPHKATMGHSDRHDHRIRVQDLSDDAENITVQRKQFITSTLLYKFIPKEEVIRLVFCKEKWKAESSGEATGSHLASRTPHSTTT